MPAKPRQLMLRKPGRLALEAGRLAVENPDKLARNLLRSSSFAKNRHHKFEIWPLLQNLGSDAVVRRACNVIARTRSTAELLAVLNAAQNDGWTETGPGIARRFAAEVAHVGKRAPARDTLQRIEALCAGAQSLKVRFEQSDLHKLLTHSSARLRGASAAYAVAMERSELRTDLLAISCSRLPCAAAAAGAIGAWGDEACATALWSRALAARRSGRAANLHNYLRMLGALGAFDCQVALRVWIEEDFSKSEDAGWLHAKSWCALARAKLAAGECERDAALNELRWFQHMAERSVVPAARMEGEGVFHLAQAYFILGAREEAANLLRRVATRSLPNPEKFPELLPLAFELVEGSGKGDEALGENAAVIAAPTAWLAAAGDLAAQRKIAENWPVLLREGRRPLNWDLRARLDREVLSETLLAALRCDTPGAIRRVLKFLCGDDAARAVHEEIERLSKTHASEVVRWKACRVLSADNDAAHAVLKSERRAPRWIRLDAAVLTGAPKGNGPKRAARSPDVVSAGLLPPDREGRGWRLALQSLRGAARRQTIQSILKAPLTRGLHRRAPFGPSYEQRPDVRAVRELAPANNPLDEQMAEMARAVMDFWVYGDEFLTLDFNGVAQVAAFLSSTNVSMDSEDVTACGAFFGEALRKRLGGEWTGFDGNYALEIKGERFDPLQLARQLFERKDPFHGPMLASEMFVSAESRLSPPKKTGAAKDTGASFERAIKNLCELPAGSSMSELMAETRVFSYRMDATDWPAVLAACDPLLENASGARIAAAITIYAPGEALARAWARWGARRRESSGLPRFVAEAMRAASERDDLEAMPDWTVQVPASRFSFLNSLRKRMSAADWRNVLMLLLRQRCAAGDLAGVGWCLFSYKYEYPDSLSLLNAFCEMTVSARQTLLRSTRHCTRDELKVFRPLWAEGLRDPAAPVMLAALECCGINRARSLRPLVETLKSDERPEIATAASAVVDALNAK